MFRRLTALCFLVFLAALTLQPVGNYLPPTTIAGLANYAPVANMKTLITNGPAGCGPIGATPSATGTGVCRVVADGSYWRYVSGATSTPTPPAGCPSGYSCFNTATTCPAAGYVAGGNGCNLNGATYGAGGTTLPSLTSGFHTYTCTDTSSDVSGLQAAVNASGDLQILGSTCLLASTVQMRSSQNVQCQNNTTTLYDPNTGTSFSESMLSYTGVSNATLTNCTLLGANNPPGQATLYPGCSSPGCSPPAADAFLIVSDTETSTNVTIEDNAFISPMGQGAVEIITAQTGTPLESDYTIDWNTFQNCALYGTVFDNVENSHEDYNTGFNCRIGNENDDSYPSQVLTGDTVNGNYVTRNQYGTGNSCNEEGSNCCYGYETWVGCGNTTNTSGQCTSSNNVAIGDPSCTTTALNGGGTGGGATDNIEFQKSDSSDTNNTCSTSTGCTCRAFNGVSCP